MSGTCICSALKERRRNETLHSPIREKIHAKSDTVLRSNTFKAPVQSDGVGSRVVTVNTPTRARVLFVSRTVASDLCGLTQFVADICGIAVILWVAKN
jgi:hypothetical protein